MLLSFAQFEREVTGERICDKIAASKKKGLWMGGLPFASVVDAVECAVDIQRGMAERNSGEPEDQRIDLTSGGPRSIPS